MFGFRNNHSLRSRRVSWRRLAGVAAVLCLLTTAAALGHRFASAGPGECRDWQPGQRCGGWRLVYDGYGSARASHDVPGWSFELTPGTAKQPGQTHAALAVSERRTGDRLVSATMLTSRQLRQPRPNQWEVAWLLWNYVDDSHFYAVVLKPNGWEISKEDPAYPGGQRFLATGATPVFPIGVKHPVQVRQTGNVIEVHVNGSVFHARDDENPYRGGAVGLYTEDASVRFTDVQA